MNTTGKILIVAVLMAAVGGAVWLKQQNNDPVKPAPATAPTPLSATEKQLPRLVDLGADKCIPCKKMAPILEELKKEYEGRCEIVFIDVWKNKTKAEGYGINLIPTQIFYDAAGKERFRHEGFFSKEDIKKKLSEIGVS